MADRSLRWVVRSVLVVVAGAAGVVLWMGTLAAVADGLGGDVEDIDFGRDLRAFAGAGSIASDGDVEALYDPAADAYEGAAAFVNPPWYALLMVPLSGIPFELLWPIWTVAGIGVAFVSLRYLGVERWASAGAALMLAVSTVFAIYFGQNSLLMVGLLSIALSAMLAGSHARAGVAFALLGFKPHLFIGFAAAALVDLRRWWRTVAVVGGVTAALVVFSALLLPGSWSGFIEALSAPGSLVDPHREVSLVAGVRLLLRSDGVLAMGASITVATAVLVWFGLAVRRSGDSELVLPGAVVVSLLVAPHALAYDWLLLVPAFAVLWVSRAMGRDQLVMWMLGAAAAVAVGPRLSEVQLDLVGIAIHLPPIVLAAFAGALWRLHVGGPVEVESP